MQDHQPRLLVPDQRLALEVTLHSWWDIRGPFEWTAVTSDQQHPDRLCSVTVNGWSGDQHIASLMMHRSLTGMLMEAGDRFSERVADYFIGGLPIQARLFDHPRR